MVFILFDIIHILVIHIQENIPYNFYNLKILFVREKKVECESRYFNELIWSPIWSPLNAAEWIPMKAILNIGKTSHAYILEIEHIIE